MKPDWEIDMMILSRKIGERLIIDRDICITILGIHENNIRLGINEPKSISLNHKEIHLSMKKEGKNVDFQEEKEPLNINKTIN